MSSSLVPIQKEVIIGIRNPQKRKIYPLSWHDMKEVQTIFFSTISGAVNLSDSGYSQEQVYQYVLSKISDHLGDILNMVVDGDPIDEKEISIDQATELATILFDMNFEGISKNVKSLLQKMENLVKASQKN